MPFNVLCVHTFVLFFQEMKPAPFEEEEELMKKWQEILGPSNEVVVSFQSEFLFLMHQITLTRTWFLGFIVVNSSRRVSKKKEE